MPTPDQLRTAACLVAGASSDDDVARIAGVSLLEIITLRAEAAAAPFKDNLSSTEPPRRVCAKRRTGGMRIGR